MDDFFNELIGMLSSKEPRGRAVGAEGLGYERYPIAVDYLIPLLSDEKEIVRKRAAESLGRLGDHMTKPQFRKIISGLDDYGNLKRKAACAYAICLIGRQEGAEPLMNSFVDGEGGTRRKVYLEIITGHLILLENSEFLGKMSEAVYKKIIQVGKDRIVSTLLDMYEKINKRRDELAKPAAEELKPPKIKKRKRKRRIWRINSQRIRYR